MGANSRTAWTKHGEVRFFTDNYGGRRIGLIVGPFFVWVEFSRPWRDAGFYFIGHRKGPRSWAGVPLIEWEVTW